MTPPQLSKNCPTDVVTLRPYAKPSPLAMNQTKDPNSMHAMTRNRTTKISTTITANASAAREVAETRAAITATTAATAVVTEGAREVAATEVVGTVVEDMATEAATAMAVATVTVKAATAFRAPTKQRATRKTTISASGMRLVFQVKIRTRRAELIFLTTRAAVVATEDTAAERVADMAVADTVVVTVVVVATEAVDTATARVDTSAAEGTAEEDTVVADTVAEREADTVVAMVVTATNREMRGYRTTTEVHRRGSFGNPMPKMLGHRLYEHSGSQYFITTVWFEGNLAHRKASVGLHSVYIFEQIAIHFELHSI